MENERIAKLEEKSCNLEKQMEKLDDKIEKIMTNHLPHIQEGVERIEKQFAYYAGGGAAILLVIEVIAKIIN